MNENVVQAAAPEAAVGGGIDPGAQDANAVDALFEEAPVTVAFGNDTGRMIRDGGDDGDIGAFGDPAPCELVGTRRRGAHLGREVLADEEDAHGPGFLNPSPRTAECDLGRTAGGVKFGLSVRRGRCHDRCSGRFNRQERYADLQPDRAGSDLRGTIQSKFTRVATRLPSHVSGRQNTRIMNATVTVTSFWNFGPAIEVVL
jgi:hypothetical protein